ncbi:MAG: Fpg/Nei family DNA glycosylase [Deltaproteobacteria bacterium]|nr:Fpg/Nei family DNA glycosylase [Deltaproteobacteria bacterium]
MPELPEVETIRQQLLPCLPAKIKQTRYSRVVGSILKTKMFSPTGKTIATISRKGKLLDFIFADGTHMISGLGMSGGWRYSFLPITAKHTHIQFTCENANGQIYLAYVDPRRFGNCHLLDGQNAERQLARLGVDVSTKEFNVDYVAALCNRFPNREIKPFLLDQACFAGVGNYMACEVLAHSRIHPERMSHTLCAKEYRQLVRAMQLVVGGSLKKRGLTFSGGYTDAKGEKGAALNNLVVFHQKICGLCQTTEVTRILQKGRTTWYCPHCQK